MDLSLSPELEGLRARIAAFVADEVLPLEREPASYDEHENIRLDLLEGVRAKAKLAGLWALQVPRDWGGL